MKRRLFIFAGIVALSLVFGIALTSSASTSIEVTPLPPVGSTDWRAGVCYSYYPDTLGILENPFIELAYNAGSRWDRFDFAWPSIQPDRDGPWQFGPHEAIVDDLQDGGIANIVGILQMTPEWAASECTLPAPSKSLADAGKDEHPPGPGSFSASVTPQDSWEDPWTKKPPQGLYQQWWDWDESDGDPDINYWGRFVYHTVDYYSDRGVENWEMWNEPEWDIFWCGTSVDYARLLEVGYRAAKEACPECKVLFGGLHYWDEPDYYKWVLNTLRDKPGAEEHDYFFDVMSVHFYSRSSDIYDKVNEIRAGMTIRNMDHPIWLTETGVPIWGDAYAWVPGMPEGNWRATTNQAASYAIQSYANAWAAGVERYFFFRAHDDWCDKNHDGDCADDGVDGGMTELFGLVRDDRTLRPSYVAYQVATRYLVSPSSVTHWRYSGGARRVTLWGTPHGKISVLWNRTPDAMTFEYPATVSAATLVDQRGATQTIYATDGVYEINLPGATASNVDNRDDYFIGGEPYLIIEEDSSPASREVRLSVDEVYGDGDGDGQWDTQAEDEIVPFSCRLVDSSGEVVVSLTGPPCNIAIYLQGGDYGLVIVPPDWPSPPGEGWLPRRLPVVVDGEAGPLEIHHDAVGLFPHRSSNYFPMVARGG